MDNFKTIEPKPGVIILPIIVPEAYHDCTFKMFPHNELMVIYPSGSYDSYCALPEGDWSIHATTTDITEEQAKVLVATNGNSKRYLDYPLKAVNTYFETAVPSTQSLFRSHGIDPNEKYVLLIKGK